MQLEDGIFKIAGAEPHTTIQAAINAAVADTRGASVLIPSSYKNNDTYTNSSGVAILDLRPASTNSGMRLQSATIATVSATSVVVRGVLSGIAATAAAAAPVTAAAGGTFVTVLDAPGTSALEGVPFTVKASGYWTMIAGTYTASVQPILYGNTTLGFTAGSANSLFSATALSVTMASAANVSGPWYADIYLNGDSTSGLVGGRASAIMAHATGASLGLPVLTASAAGPGAANALTSVNLAGATPLEFAVGVTLGGNAPATAVITLQKFFIET